MVDVTLLQDAGVLGTIAIGMGLLLRWMVQRNASQIDVMIQRSFTQADKILELAEGTIAKNSEALHDMQDTIIQNIQAKNTLVHAIEKQTETLSAKMDSQFKEMRKK